MVSISIIMRAHSDATSYFTWPLICIQSFYTWGIIDCIPEHPKRFDINLKDFSLIYNSF